MNIVRRVDELGRLVVPSKFRNKFEILERDFVEFFVDDNCIVLKKYEPNCTFCDNTKDLIKYNGKLICSKCKEEFKNQKEE